MNPYLIEYKSLALSWFLFLIIILVTTAHFLSKFKLNDLLTEEKIEDLNFKLLVGGFLGARGYYVLSNFKFYQDDLLSILQLSHLTLNFNGAVIIGVIILLRAAYNFEIDSIELISRYILVITAALIIGSWVYYFDGTITFIENLLLSLWWGLILIVELLFEDYSKGNIYIIILFFFSYGIVEIIM